MLDKLKNIIKRASDVTTAAVGQRATMKACMMGPRAVGKTTILTAIFHNTNESIAQTKLKFVPDADTMARMNVCRNDINSIFEEGKSVVDCPLAGISSTSSINVFHYEFGLKGKKAAVDLEIKDFPGEFINGGLHSGEVDQFIAESNAVLIAIDTPHLMEERGAFNDAKNMSKIICDYFKNNVEANDEKLILFVPLKCEKYYYEHRMVEVNAKVKEAYAELIDFLKDKGQVAAAITPILTIGGIEFNNLCNAVRQLTIEKIESLDELVKPKDFNATFMLMIVAPDGMLCGHIGDGRMGYMDFNGKWHSIITPHKGDEPNQTVFMMNEWNRIRIPKLKMSGVYVPEAIVVRDKPKAVALITDGCENSSWNCTQFDSEIERYVDVNTPFEPFWNTFIEMFKDDTSYNSMVDYVDNSSEPCLLEEDDRTLILGVYDSPLNTKDDETAVHSV